MLHRVLKAKYLPDCSFMEASIPSHSSYAWRSIAQARHIIRQGTRWRLGNGKSINIWRDKWVSPSSPFTIPFPSQILLEIACVHDLFYPESVQWNDILVIVRNFREIKGEQKALRHDKSLSLRLDFPSLLRDC
jgi:hypothetical protein